MDTSKLKKFASEARNILKRGVAAKMLSLGFDTDGHIDESEMPILIQGGSIFRGQQYSEAFYHQWMSLYKRIQEKGIKEVYEEAAYTWFNRFIAIRILQKNGLAEPVLDFVDVARTPHIVDAARMGHHPQMSAADEEQLRTLLGDVSAVTPQFSILITAYCHNNPIIYKCFGGIADYTELLLPNDILAEKGFIDTLNHTEFITDEDYASPELIGWLYQFYISERKDEVFAKKGKFEADEIPAATQIFTPNWIVKYMVQNTVGRIYLDNNPWATDLKAKWKYLVEPSEPTPEEAKLKYKDLMELRVGDLACGSGHILNECFDLLFDLYIEDGYSRSEAIEAIFKYNLTGIDLELKACQRDSSFADAHIMPNILNMPEPQTDEEALTDTLHHFFKGGESRQDINSLLDAFNLMRDADSLGSIMIFDIPDSTRVLIKQTVEYYDDHADQQEYFTEILSAMKLILALTEKYHALVMNPPYMGGTNMNLSLSEYVKKYYKDGKADLMTVFMIVAEEKTLANGKFSMINLPSWLFLSTFENIRLQIVNNYHIDSLLHMGRGIFGIDWGSVAFTISKCKRKTNGCFFRLHKRNFQHIYYNHIEQLFLNSIKNHSFKYDFDDYRDDNGVNTTFEHNDEGLQLYYEALQSEFTVIPGCPIGYWVSDKIRETFTTKRPLSAVCRPTQGLATADNGRFVRSWFEVNKCRIGFGFENAALAACSQKKWFPYNKGGAFRKWYGNQELVVNWLNDGQEIKNFKGAVIRNPDYYFKSSIAWSLTSSISTAFRFFPSGFIFDVNGMSLFTNDKGLLAYLNTKLCKHFLSIINPTLACQIGNVASLPFCEIDEETQNQISEVNVCICKLDWDAHETSWDFKGNELIRMRRNCMANVADLDMLPEEEIQELKNDPNIGTNEKLIEHCYRCYVSEWKRKFYQLHRNEEELNRQFIEIYGLQDELTPDVPLDEITILQQGEISIEDNELKWHADVVMKQLISYAVGCWMGRYRLDKPGLHIAHPNPTDEEVCTYKYGDSQLRIDDDGIIPILSADSAFDDNLVKRIQEFIRIAFGAETVNQNINFVEECLGTSLEKYLQKDFWKDHKKMYQSRPIYWLFSSKKGAFQCLAYMHRMDANTADKVRSNYLMKHMDWLRQTIAGLEANAITLNTAERNKLKNLRKDLAECEEYNDRLQLIADKRIAFDLDDGVVVNYAKFGDVLAKLK